MSETFLEMFEKANLDQLELAGFYWLEEMIHANPGEDDLVRQVSKYLHDKGFKFCWIPWFRAKGHDRWEEVGFDFCIHQPNYMFRADVPISRFADVTSDAKNTIRASKSKLSVRSLSQKSGENASTTT